MRVPLDPEQCVTKFAHYILQSRTVRDYIKKNSKGTSPTMKKISQGTVAAIPFPSGVPLSDQRQLVAVLDSMVNATDELVETSTMIAPHFENLIPFTLNEIFNGVEVA